MKNLKALVCMLSLAGMSFEARSSEETAVTVKEVAIDVVTVGIAAAINAIADRLNKYYPYVIANDTNKPITFRVVTEGSNCHSYDAVTLPAKQINPDAKAADGSDKYLISVWAFEERTNTCPHHIDIDLDWGANRANWGALHALGPDRPADDYQNTDSTYWGAGSWQDYGWKFSGNARGRFVLKGPSVKYPPFYDPNHYLCLSE